MQISNLAVAAEIGKGRNIGGHIHPFLSDSVHGIRFKPDIANSSHAVVRPGKTACLHVGVAIDVHQGRVSVAGVYGLNSSFGQGEEFTFGGITITIHILPDTEAGENRILGINLTVVVIVKFGKGFKTIGSMSAVGKNSVITK